MSKRVVKFKGVLVGLLAVIISLVVSNISSIASYTLTDYVLIFIVYTLVAFQLAHIKNHLKVDRKIKFILMFSFFFVIYSLLSTLEGNFFIDDYNVMPHLIVGLVYSLTIVVAVNWLWKQESNSTNGNKSFYRYFHSRSIMNWIMRIAFVLMVSFVIYMILGALAFPFTGPYMKAYIKVPTLQENFLIQVLRGVAYIIVTLPIIAVWDKRKSLHLTLSTSYILFYPIMGYAFTSSLPLPFRMMDGTVLSLHMIAFSWLIVKFLAIKETLNPK